MAVSTDADSVSSPPPALLNEARLGVRKAQEAIVRDYHSRIRSFLVTRTGNLAVADDLSQEVFVTAFQSLERLRDPSRFEGWLFAIARHKYLDHFRSMARRQRTLDGWAESTLMAEYVSADSAKATQAEERQTELLHYLRDCLETLSPHAAELIRRFYFEGQSAEQLADETDRQGGTIRMALYRIRRNLAGCIRSKLGEDA